MVEVNTAEQIDVKDSGIAVAYVTNNVEVEKATDLDIRVTKKEYSIVGDDIYIPQLYDDAPQWMKDLVQLVVDVSLTSGTTDLVNQLNATLSAFATSYVPLNQYTQSIVSLQDADTVINSLITTLNSTYNDGINNLSGQIIELQNTKASASEVVAQVISTINSELISPTSNLNATIGNLQQTIANESSARAANFETISSTLETLDGEISGNATAITNLETSVTNINNTLVAQASDITALNTELSNGTSTWASADSNLENSLMTEITDEGARVESKFAYNSNVNINGVWKKSGFGLTTNYVSGSGTQADPYVSEFWIDASRLKFTNSNQTGQVAPFTIDATGATPQITFNGKVSFSNVTNVPVINKTYVQTTQPTSGMNTGDTWIDTDDNNSLYTYNGTSWIKTQSGAKIYLQATAPTSGMIVGDILVDSDDNYKQYRYNGSSWEVLAYNPATAINTGTTTIDGGKITTNSIIAAQIATGSISADRFMAGTNSSTVWSGGGLVSENFNGNPYGNIGSPTQGFRLSSGAAGTETDPNIYGAYIKGSTVDIETLSVKATGYSGNSGRVVKYQKNGWIYMPGYGSGFLASRVCSQSESAIKVEGWYRAATNYLVAYLQYTTDGVNWVNLAVKDAQQYGYQEYFYIYFAELFNPNLVTATSQVTFRIIGNVGGSASDILISIYNN